MKETVDARGKSCPLPIVLLARKVRDLQEGSTVCILADDRAFPPDLEAWCKKTGNELLAMNDRGGFFEAEVKLS